MNCGIETYLVLAVHGIAAAITDAASSSVGYRSVVAPTSTTLSIRAVTSHVTGVAADTADDASGEVLLLGAVILAMANLAAILACLVLIVTKCTVESCKLTKLVALQLVLAFRNRGSLKQPVSFDMFV